ncbi:MAG: DUF3298 and DUF4163 domain-containing protein [Christensenellales bacterium]
MTHDMLISLHDTEDELFFGKTKVLKFSLQYPLFSSARFGKAANALNGCHKNRADICRRQIRQALYIRAVRDLKNSSGDVPFRPYEAVITCTVTYNQCCFVSLYFDTYRYMGGAHGSTLRSSETWDLNNVRRVAMARFFPPAAPYKTIIIGKIAAQIMSSIEKGSGAYFDDYEANAARCLNTSNFFLVPEGLKVYYQQYQLAPYSGGIPEFLIPFSDDMQSPCL